MAKVICTELQKDGASGPNITLDTSKNVTCENNLQVDGNVTVTGTLPADKLTGALPAISGASLTGISSSPPAFRNIFVNGDMRIAQRSTAAVASQNPQTTDRFYYDKGGTDENPTQERRALTSSDTGPWAKGFKYCFKITNGNQSSGPGASDYIRFKTTVEARDLKTSGWLYNDTNSKLTISFWVRTSISQRFYCALRTDDGTAQHYAFPFTPAANTWTYVTHSIPGAAGLQFDDNAGSGIMFQWYPFVGTTWTNESFTENTWAAYSSTSQTKDYDGDDNDWYAGNDATWEITGCQLEVADTATDFEFRPYSDELLRCQRYYYVHVDAGNSEWDTHGDADKQTIGVGANYQDTNAGCAVKFPVKMRVTPGIVAEAGADYYMVYGNGATANIDGTLSMWNSNPNEAFLEGTLDGGLGGGTATRWTTNNNAARIAFDAEF